MNQRPYQDSQRPTRPSHSASSRGPRNGPNYPERFQQNRDDQWPSPYGRDRGYEPEQRSSRDDSERHSQSEFRGRDDFEQGRQSYWQRSEYDQGDGHHNNIRGDEAYRDENTYDSPADYRQGDSRRFDHSRRGYADTAAPAGQDFRGGT